MLSRAVIVRTSPTSTSASHIIPRRADWEKWSNAYVGGFAAIADPGSDPATIGTVQSVRLAESLVGAQGGDAALPRRCTQRSRRLVRVGIAGLSREFKGWKVIVRREVFGIVQGLKLQLSGIVSNVRVIDAHHLGYVYDETAVLAGSADTIDSAGAHNVSGSWLHKITFVRAASGTLTVSRDRVIARFS